MRSELLYLTNTVDLTAMRQVLELLEKMEIFSELDTVVDLTSHEIHLPRIEELFGPFPLNIL
jgi:hypothetical protein